ncbi:ATP-binding cassette domain-containing protein [Pollutibacter soli]|uniref:ATP-binding cassette domain-containing protein n=1 Tax=Pollutibacter soli TaxID=3034157 RepID=UPI0030135A62
MYCIETKNLDHRFSSGQQVLSNINLKIPSGSIFGFLGPNGAGKTTTLRLLLGLLKKQSGKIEFFGEDFEKQRIPILKKTGSLIESPSFYGQLTAAENLEILQRVYCIPKKRINEALQIVGLADTGNKKSSRFSLGMKQRLSIAMAILHNPDILILDEPTNGLDPNGIIEIRALLKSLNEDHKMTILISSHLLSEIEKLVTHTGIIHKGKLIFQGTLNQLQQKQERNSITSFETDDNEKAFHILQQNKFEISSKNGKINLSIQDKTAIAGINRILVENKIDVYQIHSSNSDLESIFMEMVSK